MQGRASLQFSLADYEGSGGLDATLLRDHTVDGLDSGCQVVCHGISEKMQLREEEEVGCEFADQEYIVGGGCHLSGEHESAAKAISAAD